MRSTVSLLIVSATVAFAFGSPPQGQGQTIAADTMPGASTPAQVASPLPLAANGYCVVTLRDAQRWLPGNPLAATLFDGREYRFASPRELAIFVASPETYAPVLDGDCAVTYAESKERRAGQPRHAALHRGRLYFFADESCLRRFTQQPEQFENIDLANGGRCPVSRRVEQRDVAGMPDTVAIYGGMRYFFVSAHHRAQFLTDPETFGATANPRKIATQADSRLANVSPHLGKSDAQLPAETDESATVVPGKSNRGEDVLLDAQPAMGGYCPVSIRENGVWIRGRYDYRVELGELVLLTAGSTEHDALLHDPVKYIPALSGDCAVTFVDEGQRVRGSIFHAAEYHGRLFLFADAQRKSIFKADPERYASVDLAAGGACRVTQVDEAKTAPGLAEFAAWYGGLIYHFAGADEKRKFLAAPERYIASSSVETPEATSAPESP
jgi:YHS domain-containing protein